MNFLNQDFVVTGSSVDEFRNFYLTTDWANSSSDISEKFAQADPPIPFSAHEQGKTGPLGTLFWNTIVLSQRTAVNYSRNLLAYGVRAGMYAGT